MAGGSEWLLHDESPPCLSGDDELGGSLHACDETESEFGAGLGSCGLKLLVLECIRDGVELALGENSTRTSILSADERGALDRLTDDLRTRCLSAGG